MILFVGLVLSALSLVGLVALVLMFMLESRLNPPPPLATILDGALQLGEDALAEIRRFQARDGTWLAYRRYSPAAGGSRRIALLAHGSAGASGQMNAIGHALASAGFEAVSFDIRGHGASGARGDIAYVGQLDDDLADLIAELRKRGGGDKLAFVGHSSGGGYALRVASGPMGPLFERFVLLAPYLGHRSPTVRPSEAAKGWANADVPRIIAISILARLGIDWPQSLPVIAFATGPDAKKFVTDQYTFRLMASYAAPDDWQAAIRRSPAPIDVIVGSADELMDALAFERLLPPLGARVTLVSGCDHMGVCWRPDAIKTVVAALSD